MISFMQMAAAVSGSSETSEGTEKLTPTKDKAPEDKKEDTVTADDNSSECPKELTLQFVDSEQEVTLENVITESSVDPEPEVLIALANESLNASRNTDDEKDGGDLISEGTVTPPNTPREEESYEFVVNTEEINLNLNENEKYDSETSEKNLSEILFDNSEISEQPVEEEIIPESLSSTQEEPGIFITQDVQQEGETIEENMPEKRDEEVVSPSLQRANLRFRWAKTIPTTSHDIIFFSSHKREEPIKLRWSEGADCFYSKDMEIPTGIYKGTLVVDQKSYPVDELTVKHYTFEADLYIKEDIIEDNFTAARVDNVEHVDTYGDLNKSGDEQKGLHYSGKIEDIIRQQMHSADTEQEFTSKSDHGSGRHTPIGDVGMETYQDILNNSYSKNVNASIVEDEMEQSFNQSQRSSKPQTPQPTVEEIIENTLRESRSAERTTPQADLLADIFDNEGRRTPIDHLINGEIARETTPSLHSSARQTPQKDYVGDVLGYDQSKSPEGSVHSYDQPRTPIRSTEGSLHGSVRHTPLDDIIGKGVSPSGGHHGSTHSSTRQTPQQLSAHSSARQTPQQMSESFRTSQEKLYGSQSSMPGFGGSRPQSLTSEQELTQYFEQNSKRAVEPASSSSTKTPTPQYTAVTQNAGTTGSRAHSTSSLPVITTQQRLQAEKRSMTPDNYIRIPGNQSSPVTVARPSSVTRGATPASRASSRTITPANEVEREFLVDNVAQKRIDDLEDTVRNLRKLLSAREHEVHELTDQLNDIRDINRSLQDELRLTREKQNSGPKPGSFQELERRYSLLSDEKEILAQEVVTLQDRIDDLQRQVGRHGQPDGEVHPSLSSYDPNNPSALQRKIADLRSQVQDLQEANESAVEKLTKAEKRIGELTSQNEGLHTAKNVNQQDLQAENRRLHDQVARLWEQGYGDGDHKMRVENQQLRDDNRAIRERNYKLHEENIKLKEELSEIRRVLERQSTDTKISRISSASLEPESYDYKTPSERSKLPNISIDRPLSATAPVLNGHSEYRLSPDKDGHRYSYRQNKDEKLYTSLSDSANKYSSQRVDTRFITDSEKSEPHFKKDSYSYKSSYDHDFKSPRDTNIKEESRFRSSLERAEAKLRSSLEKTSYLDRISRYDTKTSDRLKSDDTFDRSFDSHTPERLKPESYRSVPDGISDKEELSPSQRYDTTPDRHSNRKDYKYDTTPDRHSNTKDYKYDTTPDRHSNTKDYKYDTTPDRHSSTKDYKTSYDKRIDYSIEPRSLASIDKDYKGLTSSYPELARIAPVSSSERIREFSRSEVELRPARGRSRSPEWHALCPHRSGSPDHGLPPAYQPTFRFRNITKRRMPHQVYKWDGKNDAELRNDNMMSSYTLPRVSKSVMSYGTRDYYYDRDYDRYEKKYTSYQSDGNDSDTATDILVSAQPYEQRISPTSSPIESPDHRIHPKYHRRSHSQRRDSLGSEGSSIEDVEESYNKQRLHNRSKSADGRELLRRAEPMGSTGRSPTPKTERLMTGDPGFRTVTPNILHTQHNRTVDRGPLTNLTSGMRPFAPRTPGDINIEDVVKFSRQGGKLSQGKVKFVGHLPGRSDVYLGVELDKEDGKHDGTFEGVRYYKCKPSKGVFVAFNKVVMAWAPNI